MRRVALVLVLLLAGCGGSGDELPDAVETFERRLEAPHGVLHVVTEEIRIQAERGLPDLPPLGFSDEVWLDLGGDGWSANRTSRDGGFQQVADERGIRTFTRDGRSQLHRLRGHEYLMRPWIEGAVVDPVRLVRERALRVTGEETVAGRPAYVVAPVPPQGIRLYVARDDGELVRVTQRRRHAGRMRTEVQDYLLFELRVPPPRNLGDLLDRLR